MKNPTQPMKTKNLASSRLAPALVAVALIACCPFQTRADTIALSFTSIPGSFRAVGTYGWAFTLSNPVLVTQLGLWNDPFGLNLSHEVDIWTSGGTLVPGAQATILPTSTLNADGF